MERRLVDLETRYTHMERQLAELDKVVFGQQKAIDQMAKQLAALVARLREAGTDAPHEKPPHF